MKRDFGMVFRVLLVVSDALATMASFLAAYFIRTHLDQRPFYFAPEPWEFVSTFAYLLPLYLLILACFGLYRKNIFLSRSRLPEIGRLLLASVVGMMAIISVDFFLRTDLFPVRIMAVYAAATCFLCLVVFRGLVRALRRLVLRLHHASAERALIIGNNRNTEYLADYIAAYPESGFRLAGIVAGSKYIPRDLRRKQYSSLKEALRRAKPDVIFQTEEKGSEYVYRQALNHHLDYYYVPSSSDISSQMGDIEFIGTIPAISVPVTPLANPGARFFKRFMDLLLSFIALVIAAIPMGIIWLAEKISDPHSPAIYAETRLSRYNRRFRIYKFRSMKPEFCGLSPEEAFTKLGKPSLIKKYRGSGDKLEHDPRITRLGSFLRATSLDELPQLFNVFRGDISLVGPRALVSGELRDYGDRSLLLSVKSGLTGLAQVSGRRDIAFDERRALDIYYIQNWSPLLDLRILFRTVGAVLLRKGAK